MWWVLVQPSYDTNTHASVTCRYITKHGYLESDMTSIPSPASGLCSYCKAVWNEGPAWLALAKGWALLQLTKVRTGSSGPNFCVNWMFPSKDRRHENSFNHLILMSNHMSVGALPASFQSLLSLSALTQRRSWTKYSSAKHGQSGISALVLHGFYLFECYQYRIHWLMAQ